MNHSSAIDNTNESASFFALNPNRELISGSWQKLLWIFCVLSILGLCGETLQHYLFFGVWEHRAGFVWGPFSPIYGLAAVLMTVFLEPIIKKPAPIIFIVACVVGGGLEYFASWAMETFWGVVAWSYINWPFNFDGRTDLFHSCLWGLIGFAWIKLGIPICDKIFALVDTRGFRFKICTIFLSVFFAFNIFFTCTSLLRANERTVNIPQNDPIDVICDIYFSDDFLRDKFNNMGGLGMP